MYINLVFYYSAIIFSVITISYNTFGMFWSFFFVDFFEFPTYKIMSSANRDNFTSSFLLWKPLISFSLLVPLSKTSYTMMNRDGENRHSCLVPDLKSFSLSPLSMMFHLSCAQ